jgi:hypothetical protein
MWVSVAEFEAAAFKRLNEQCFCFFVVTKLA